MGLNRIHFLRSICRWPIMISLRCLLVKSLREDSVQHLPNFGHLGCLSLWGFFYWSCKHRFLREGASWLDNSHSVHAHLLVQEWTYLHQKSSDVEGQIFLTAVGLCRINTVASICKDRI